MNAPYKVKLAVGISVFMLGLLILYVLISSIMEPMGLGIALFRWFTGLILLYFGWAQIYRTQVFRNMKETNSHNTGRMPSHTRNPVYKYLAFIVIVVVPFIIVHIQGIALTKQLEALYAFGNRFPISNYANTVIKSRSDQSYIYRKAIIIEEREGGLEISHFNIELRDHGFPIANSPAEVGTAILLKYGSEKIGEYVSNNGTRTGSVKVETCHIQIIDVINSTLIGETTLKAKSAAEMTKTPIQSMNEYTKLNEFHIKEYIESLPKLAIRMGSNR